MTLILTIVIMVCFVLLYVFSPKIIKTVDDFLDEKDFIKYCQKIVAKEYVSTEIRYSYPLNTFLWAINHVSDRMINRKFFLGCGTKEDIVSIKRIWGKAYGQYLVDKRNGLDKESIKDIFKYCNLTKEDLMYLDLIYSETDEETYQFFKKNEKKYCAWYF